MPAGLGYGYATKGWGRIRGGARPVYGRIVRARRAPGRPGARLSSGGLTSYSAPLKRPDGRRPSRWRLVVVVLIGLAITALILLAVKRRAAELVGAYALRRAGDVVTVAAGDSLWSIAERNAPEGVDLRWFVEGLRRVNDVGDPGGLRPGTRLVLPRFRR